MNDANYDFVINNMSSYDDDDYDEVKREDRADVSLLFMIMDNDAITNFFFNNRIAPMYRNKTEYGANQIKYTTDDVWKYVNDWRATIIPEKDRPFKGGKVTAVDDKIRVVVHGGVNHFDDRAVCALMEVYTSFHNDNCDEDDQYEIVFERNTNPEVNPEVPCWELEKPASIIADIGRIYDPEKGYFDHHQELPEGKESYAAFGLLWDYLTTPETREYYKEFTSFVRKMDAHDTGVMNSDLCNFIRATYLPVQDIMGDGEDEDFVMIGKDGIETDGFIESVKWLATLFRRYFMRCHAKREAEKKLIEESETLEIDGKKVFKVSQGGNPAALGYAIENGYDVLFFQCAENDDRNPNKYLVRTVPLQEGSHDTKWRFPHEWSEKETAPACVRFCHKSGFMMVVDTEDDAKNLIEGMILLKNAEKKKITITISGDDLDLNLLKKTFDKKFPTEIHDLWNGAINELTTEDESNITVDMDKSLDSNMLISHLSDVMLEGVYNMADEILDRPAGV